MVHGLLKLGSVVGWVEQSDTHRFNFHDLHCWVALLSHLTKSASCQVIGYRYALPNLLRNFANSAHYCKILSHESITQ